MSGICGIATSSRELIPERRLIQAMCCRLRLRGPDGEGVQTAVGIGLGHRRLGVFDPETDRQPVQDETSRYSIVCDGEIYNCLELRQRLEAKGARFVTQSATEVLLQGLIAEGVPFLRRVAGVFAFAFWDACEHTLLLARDRLGIKPLYWARMPDGGLAFASDAGAVVQAFEQTPDLDMRAVGLFLALSYIPGEASVYSGVKRLEPGTVLRFSAVSGTRTETWWSLAETWKNAVSVPEREVVPQFLSLLEDAVRVRLRSDAPLGAFLSSGIDSASIAACMAGMAGKVHTFCMGFADPAHDETAGAAATAVFLGANHSTLAAETGVQDVLPALAAMLDEPFADTSLIPTYLLCGLAKQHIAVALSGDGGDELLAGYETLRADALYRRLSALPALLPSLGKFMTGLLPERRGKISFTYKVKQFFAGYPLKPEDAHAWWRMLLRFEQLTALVPDVPLQAEDLFAPFRNAWQESEGLSSLNRFLYVDYVTWLRHDILVKADRASMNNGLELRSPFLDHRLLEFCAGLPEHWKRVGGRGKVLLYKAMAEKLPPHVLARRKLGFNAPVSRWLCGPWKDMAEYAFSREQLKNVAPFLAPQTVGAMWKEHRSGKRDHGFRLFAVLMLVLWLGGREG